MKNDIRVVVWTLHVLHRFHEHLSARDLCMRAKATLMENFQFLARCFRCCFLSYGSAAVPGTGSLRHLLVSVMFCVLDLEQDIMVLTEESISLIASVWVPAHLVLDSTSVCTKMHAQKFQGSVGASKSSFNVKAQTTKLKLGS